MIHSIFSLPFVLLLTAVATGQGKDPHELVREELRRQNGQAGSPLTPGQLDAFCDALKSAQLRSAQGEAREIPSIVNGFYDSPGPATDRTIPRAGRIPLLLVHGSSSDIISDGSFGRPLDDIERWNVIVPGFNGDAQFASQYKVYRFVYDSRLSIFENGANLVRVIDGIQSYPGWAGEDLDDEEFVVLAHSMGGLVTRTAMNIRFTEGQDAGQRFGDHVRRLVTLGTPHHGSPAAIPAWPADTTMRGEGSEAEFVLMYVTGLGFAPVAGQFDLAWDNFDDGVPLGDIAAFQTLFVVILTAVGGGLPKHREGLLDPFIGVLNQVDVFQHKLVCYAAIDPPEGHIDTMLELSALFIIGQLNEQHLLGFTGSRLGKIIAGDIGEGGTQPYDTNDGLVPLASARLDGHAVAEVFTLANADHTTFLYDAAAVTAIRTKLISIGQ